MEQSDYADFVGSAINCSNAYGLVRAAVLRTYRDGALILFRCFKTMFSSHKPLVICWSSQSYQPTRRPYQRVNVYAQIFVTLVRRMRTCSVSVLINY